MIILASLVFIMLMLRVLSTLFISPPNPDLSKATLLLMKEAIQESSTYPADSPAVLTEKADELNNETAAPKLTPFQFDPNTADKETLTALGLNPSQVKNIINFRSKGGKFRIANDFGKLFSISKEELNILLPYISIASESFTKTKTEHRPEISTRPNALQPAIVELNSADSIALLSLPGSGPWTAHRIIRYRQLLGGYIKPEQLLEVRGIDSLKLEAMKHWLVIDHSNIQLLRINYMEFRDLIRHPYLSFDQVKSLINHRDRKGFIRNSNEMLNLQHFSHADLERLQAYLRFD